MNEFSGSGAQPPATTVAAYISQLNRVLATQRGRIKGEVTSIKPYPKAIYFTIKDKDGQALLDCSIWVWDYQKNGVRFKVGDEIIVTGYPDIYALSGRFCFKASTIEYAGEGALKQAYDKLKATLAGEELFAPARKRPLPKLPTKIGVITSLSGVVIQDFSTNLSRHGFKVKTVDSRVEGKDAIHDLLAALKTMSKQDIEVLVIMRGGGSLESLQAFNTESVVRAIANFEVPVLTGIGHDVDVTLAEMVADIGRSTPTAVAEALNEPWDGLVSSLSILQSRVLSKYQSVVTDNSRVINDSSNMVFRAYERRLSGVRSDVSSKSTRIAAAFARLAQRVRDANSAVQWAAGIMRSNLKAKRRYIGQVPNRLRQHIRVSLRSTEQRLKENFVLIAKRQATAITHTAKVIPVLERAITTNDPRRNMRLGYSLSYVNGKLARNIADVTVGETMITLLADGQFTSEVKEVE